MMKCGTMPTDEEWLAITTNDVTYNERFVYAVRSTKICCKPSCPSRLPHRDKVCIFSSLELAMEQGFRPCKRCRPANLKLPNEEWVSLINDYLETHYMYELTLDMLAERFHGSKFHLQRIYKEIMGVTPAKYMQQLRLIEAKRLLEETTLTINDIAERVGFHSSAYFIAVFKAQEQLTPKQYQLKVRNDR